MISSLSEKRAKQNRSKEDAPQKSKKKPHMFFAAIHSFFHSLLFVFRISLSLYENIKKAQTLSGNEGKRDETYRYFVVLVGWRKPFEVLLQRHRQQQTQKECQPRNGDKLICSPETTATNKTTKRHRFFLPLSRSVSLRGLENRTTSRKRTHAQKRLTRKLAEQGNGCDSHS